MKSYEEMEAALAWEIEYAEGDVVKAQNRINFIRKYSDMLKQIGVLPNSYGGLCDLTTDSHEEAMSLVKGFASKFDKNYDDANTGRVTYSCVIDGVTVQIKSHPPNICKIVTYEEEVPEQIVPAHKVMKCRIECPKQEEAEA